MSLKALALVTVAIACIVLVMPTHPLLSGYGTSSAPGLYFVMVCFGLFSWGYLTAGRPSSSGRTPRGGHLQHAVLPFSFSLGWLVISVIGVSVVFLQLASTVGVEVYLRAMLGGGAPAEIARAQGLKVQASIGGLPGYLKVLHVTPVMALVFLCSAQMQGILSKGRRQNFVSSLIVAVYLVRTVIYSDRMPQLIFVPLAFQFWSRASQRVRLAIALSAVILFALMEVISQHRGLHRGLSEYIVLYVQSGALNESLTLSEPISYSFGVRTVFSGISWLLKAIGYNPFPDEVAPHWIWSDAQNGYGYLLLDFGATAALLFAAWGVFSARLDTVARRILSSRTPIPDGSLLRTQTLSVFALLSLISVPCFIAAEFWLMCVGLILSAKLEYRSLRGRKRPTRAVFVAREYPCDRPAPSPQT